MMANKTDSCKAEESHTAIYLHFLYITFHLINAFMENYTHSSIDSSAIALMHRIRQKYVHQQQELTIPCLLLEEKLIYSHILLAEHNPHASLTLPPIKQLIVDFVQKTNRIAMQTLQHNDSNDFKRYDQMLSKSISLLMLPRIDEYLADAPLITKLKILSFNNLSCLYKQKKKYGVAMRTIDFAVKLEEELLKTQPSEQKYDIIPTYLNKAAVYSEMKKHSEAIAIIQLAKACVESIEGELSVQIEQTAEESEKKRLLEKRYYGMYMKMIIFYNLGAEKEHLRVMGEAVDWYKQSKQIAIIIDNQLMSNKLTPIIDQLMAAK